MAKKGVDLSKHNGTLTISAVKKAGYDFVILRGGVTGYASNRPKKKDVKFESYYKQCKALGMPVGCYYYSCATSEAGGRSEAEFLYNNCLKGKQFEYPIYIDVEEARWQAHNKTGVTNAIIGFCEYLEDKGYYVGIYSSLDWFKNKLDTKRLDNYSKWVAAWRSSKPSFPYSHFDMWQNSSNGKIGWHRVDTNVAYIDFEKIIKENGLNGFSKPSPKPTIETGTYELTSNRAIHSGFGMSKPYKKIDELTEDGKKHAVEKNGHAVLLKGTKVTVEKVKTMPKGSIWVKIPSGYFCAYSKKKNKMYIKK